MSVSHPLQQATFLTTAAEDHQLPEDGAAEIAFAGNCPKCNTELHCCKQCSHFEPSTRFQCLKPIPMRIAVKDKSNQCELFTPRVTVAREGVAVPVPERKLAYVNSEAIQENCQEPLNYASIVDIADPARPRLEAMLPLPQPRPEW